MTRVDLLPGAAMAVPVERVRVKALLRPRKPLTARERLSAFDRIRKRILKGGEPFGVFVIKHGRGRVIRLISIHHADFAAQLRVDQARQHMISTYDSRANLGDVWSDLCGFDQAAAT